MRSIFRSPRGAKVSGKPASRPLVACLATGSPSCLPALRLPAESLRPPGAALPASSGVELAFAQRARQHGMPQLVSRPLFRMPCVRSGSALLPLSGRACGARAPPLSEPSASPIDRAWWSCRGLIALPAFGSARSNRGRVDDDMADWRAQAWGSSRVRLAAANRYWLVRSSKPAARRGAATRCVRACHRVVILGLVALWPPAAARALGGRRSPHIHGRSQAEIEIERASSEWRRAVLVLDGAFQPLAAKEVTLVLANPRGIEPSA